MYVCKVHPELCFVWWNLSATTALLSSFQCFSTAAIVLLCYASSSVFSKHSVNSKTLPNYSICAKDVCCDSQSMFSSLNHLHNYRSSSSSNSSSSKTTALHTTTLTAWLVLIVCFFSLAIIQELSHDCSRANEYLQRLSVKEICKGPWQDFAGIGRCCSTSP